MPKSGVRLTLEILLEGVDQVSVCVNVLVEREDDARR